ncbi:DUF1496 domain-containing protein [Candidatus Fukatsuia symbiotica]|uniref:DUF1496 domain-containing protein n=1 Tax=Candidatus Fukatsuia symbiotica TaxID=1878942 RepID=A0A2U8I828_9GAMM|nr:hypothetical protein CCS41_00785 [Candidatus Fukatsuia symbiotica]
MIKKVALLCFIVCTLLFSSVASAVEGNNVNLVVPLPAELLKNPVTTNSNNSNPCIRCCVYQNQSYTEGAILQIPGGISLQCTRDKNSVRTNPLIWQRLTH